jgi:hypothetical protein
MEILNIDLEEKMDSTVRITYTDDTTNLPMDITDYSAILQIRPSFGSDVVIDELTSGAGLVLGGQSGTIDITFVPSDTDQSGVPYAWTTAAYDLVLIDPQGKRKKLLKGFITIARSASLGTPP